MVREGVQKEIEASELVLGDIVSIKGGDKTPADIRMLECHSIKVSCIGFVFFKVSRWTTPPSLVRASL